MVTILPKRGSAIQPKSRPPDLYSKLGDAHLLSMDENTRQTKPKQGGRIAQQARAAAATIAFAVGVAGAGVLGSGTGVQAGEDFRFPMTADQAAYWRFVTDGVMGGVSRGKLSFESSDDVDYARLTGDVSTANNGGFIQLRAGISFGALEDGGASLKGIRIRARGNGEPYFIHLRTKDNRRPWHYYAARFATGDEWQDISLNFNGFRHSAGMAPDRPQPQDIVSIGIVAYGRDHRADLSVAEISFY